MAVRTKERPTRSGGQLTSVEAELANDAHPHDQNGYNNHGCRGPVCRAAHSAGVSKTRAQRRAHTAKHGLPAHVRHGASAYTNWGCKCDTCTSDHAAVNARQRSRGTSL